MVLRIAIADVDRITVVRIDGLTMVYRPAMGDRDDLLKQSAAQLEPREVAMVRCATHVRGLPDYALTTPDVACPCYVPGALRAPVGDWRCPLHNGPAPVPLRRRVRLLAMRLEHLDTLSPIGTHGGLRVTAIGLVVAFLASKTLSLSLSLRGMT